MTIDAALVARMFDLGEVCSSPLLLPGHSPAGTWKLHTTTGRWVVKTLRPSEGWEFEAMQQAGDLERAVLSAGVLTPRPVEACGISGGYWLAMSEEPKYVRVSEWLEGTQPEIPASEDLAAWLGRSVAAMAAVSLPVTVDEGRGYPLYPLAVWHEWLDKAYAMEIVTAKQRAQLLAAVADGTQLVEAGLATDSSFLLCHRDINHRNILLTARGPALIDFDHSGPEVPWWELVHFALLLACRSLGDDEPDPRLVKTAVSAFVENGGEVGTDDEIAFAGLIRGMMEWPACRLMTLLGSAETASPTWADTVAQVHEAAELLPVMVRSVGRWTALLR
ncbi:phosphotransferase enzyme family protein [Planomonospora sp. ID82291]|uniref:phosphotransferase enzyme family protein n=1 Tax=Planomonospora sp. ID82291 TaxID=2738136 RepID=UPI0018C40A4E|nr:aminoglycoside phosphotransferase family protein [Planomonospora sp. ID82291]MBG0814649.1 aminoglycoside phosphotransferase family protein [Planomonospora sp. ID82291]